MAARNYSLKFWRDSLWNSPQNDDQRRKLHTPFERLVCFGAGQFHFFQKLFYEFHRRHQQRILKKPASGSPANYVFSNDWDPTDSHLRENGDTFQIHRLYRALFWLGGRNRKNRNRYLFYVLSRCGNAGLFPRVVFNEA